MTSRQTPRAKALSYINGVLSGTIITSRFVRLQIERHERDLEFGADRGLTFDENKAQRVIAFIESFIVGTEGDYDSKPFVLEGWICCLLWILYGWTWTATGKRRFKFSYIEISRGNLKSTLASALCLYELLAFGETGAQVYAAATDKATAKLVFDTACLMVQRSEPLRKRIRNFRNNLHIPGTASKFEPCTSEDSNLLGLRPSFVCLDELHAHSSSGVWDVFYSAMGKRSQPLLFAITNSGYDRQSVCWKQREYVVRVLEQIVPDDTWFGWVCGLDPEDVEDWANETNWIKANPSLGVAVSLEDMRSQARKAKEDPSSLNSFLRFRLSVWTESHTQWMLPDVWAACNAEPGDLTGRPCFAGLDLSTTIDLSALVLLFPPHEDDILWRVIPYFWLPEEAMTKRSKRDRVPYDVWTRQGLIYTTPGNTIDYGFIRAKINELAAQYDIREIAYDPYNATDIVQNLINDGLTLVPFRQGEVSMNAPCKRLMELVMNQELAHGGNAVLSWMANNTVIRIGSTGLLKPDKERSREKIDGITALLDALGRAMVAPEDNRVITYRGLRSVS